MEVRLLSALPDGSAARVGRATASHAEGWEFDSPRIHQKGCRLAARTPRFQRGRRRFKSGRPYQSTRMRGAKAAPGSHKPRDPGSIPGHATRARSSSAVQGAGPSCRIRRFESATGHHYNDRPGIAQQPEQRSDMPPSGGASPPPRTRTTTTALGSAAEPLRDRQTSGGSSPAGRTTFRE